jgi:hypothetical protein
VEGMVDSPDKLIMEITKETRLYPKGEDAEDEEHEDDDNGGDVTTPEGIIMEEDTVEVVLEHEAPVVHEVILVDAEPELPQHRLYRMLMRDYEESSSRMMDDLDDLDDWTEAYSNMDEWFPKDGSNDRD